MTDEKIMALHPDPTKQGTNIDRAKYEVIKQGILEAIDDSGGEIAFGNLAAAVAERAPDFDGSIGWYTTSVKLDLEAREIIERVPKVSPQRIRRARS